jgi:hypothetical protein
LTTLKQQVIEYNEYSFSAVILLFQKGGNPMKKTLICGVAVAFVAAFALAGVSFADGDKGPAEMTMNADGKKPALFPHAAHQEKIKCGECHHSKSADGKQVAYVEGQKIEKCASCHTGDMLKDGANKVKGKTAMQRAGHGNCLKCHKAEAKKDPAKKGLKKCSNCHPKKK